MQEDNICHSVGTAIDHATRFTSICAILLAIGNAVSTGAVWAAEAPAPPAVVPAPVTPSAPAATPSTSTTSSSSLAETTIHLYYLVGGYKDLQDPTSIATLCSAPRAQLKVGADDGTTLTVAVDTEKATEENKGAICKTSYVKESGQYTIPKSNVMNASPTIQGFVSGVLAVPFKYHLSDHSTTAGSTIGGYVGYRTSVANAFAMTPVLAGGLALVSTSAAQVTSTTSATATTPAQTTGSQTSAGFSIATGLIGSVTSAASKGAQFGVLVGIDWLGKKANYAYEGKPWIAFEIGYNFAL